MCLCQTIFHLGVSCVFWFILILSHFVAIKTNHLGSIVRSLFRPSLCLSSAGIHWNGAGDTIGIPWLSWWHLPHSRSMSSPNSRNLPKKGAAWWFCPHIDSRRSWWFLMVFDGFWWFLMVFDGFWWFLMVFDGFWWFLMVFDGFWWSRNPCCVKFVDSFSSAGKLPETSLLPFCFAWKRRRKASNSTENLYNPFPWC